jgi:hypothetical protein
LISKLSFNQSVIEFGITKDYKEAEKYNDKAK